MRPLGLRYKSGKGFQLVHRCLKCGEEFDAMFEAKCPKCGAMDWDVEPLRKYKLAHPETPIEVPVTGEK